MKLEDAQFLLKELKGNECPCGKNKKSGNSFCYSCYSSLPEDLQKALYKRFGQGYGDAYEEAHEWLKIWVWEE